MNYEKTKTLSTSMNERSDCSVKAVAIACDVAYKVAHKALANSGRRDREGVPMFKIKHALDLLGYRLDGIMVAAKTVASIPKDKAFSDGFFMVVVSRHVLAVKDGKVEDWTDGRRNRIQAAFRVVPNATRKERKQRAAVLFC